MSQLDFSLGVIGAGSMGAAIVHGLLEAGVLPAERVFVCNPGEAKRAVFAQLGCPVYADAADLMAADTDVVILAVKPQVLPAVMAEIADSVAGRLLVSIAAGVPLAVLEAALPGARVLRVMPNLPIQVRSGASALCVGTSATSTDVARVSAIFETLGACAQMSEVQLDVEGAVVGCSPAFFALVIDAFTRAGVRAGLPATSCREMLISTMEGVARQLREGEEHPRAYMEKVTSPGGTTAEGLRALEPALVEGAYTAVDAALARTRELAG